jgi:hypothetical protein
MKPFSLSNSALHELITVPTTLRTNPTLDLLIEENYWRRTLIPLSSKGPKEGAYTVSRSESRLNALCFQLKGVMEGRVKRELVVDR